MYLASVKRLPTSSASSNSSVRDLAALPKNSGVTSHCIFVFSAPFTFFEFFGETGLALGVSRCGLVHVQSERRRMAT